jgi:hypothetical protein
MRGPIEALCGFDASGGDAGSFRASVLTTKTSAKATVKTV